MLSYSIAKTEIWIAYVSKTGSFLEFEDSFAICPWRNGISSPYNGLQILMEFLGSDYYKLHTIEVNNKDSCNVKVMNAIRRKFNLVPYDSHHLDSQLLNERAVIDVEFLKTFDKLTDKDFDLDILETNFLKTKDDQYPTDCELRVFVSKTK